MKPIDRLGELVARRYALIAELQPDHALRALDAVGLGGAQQQVGDRGAVADQLAACVGEALRNIGRHAGTGEAEVTVTGGSGWAVVKITDRGRGFDPAATPPSRRGIRESITGRMLAAGGQAAISSRPGAGTTVTISWPA